MKKALIIVISATITFSHFFLALMCVIFPRASDYRGLEEQNGRVFFYNRSFLRPYKCAPPRWSRSILDACEDSVTALSDIIACRKREHRETARELPASCFMRRARRTPHAARSKSKSSSAPTRFLQASARKACAPRFVFNLSENHECLAPRPIKMPSQFVLAIARGPLDGRTSPLPDRTFTFF